jgi:hypothetical protein
MKRVSITPESAYGSALDRLTGGAKPVEPAPKAPEKEQPSLSMIKLSVFLNHEEDAYLEGLASTAKFSGGKKMSKTQIIETMVRAFRTTELDVQGVKTSEDLFQRLSAQLRK